MVFSSNIFIFSFLPLFLGCYYLVSNQYRNWVILAGSYSFYAWWRVDFLMLFVAVTLFNFYIGKKVSGNSKAKIWLTFGVVGNLTVLGYFKYANFGLDSFNTLLTYSGVAPFNIVDIILPIGISFYIFQSISYIVDVYRRDVPPSANLVDFAAFVSLFPQLIAGPVLRYKDLADQFTHRKHSWSKFNQGCSWFMIGFIKKVFIADSIAPIVDASFSSAIPSMQDAWLGALAYTAQLYFDFSGYSDMAIGLGLMMGFRFINNFNQPYVSQSVTEFWQRWHISLSTWLRDYLYIPLGGNRKGSLFTYRNLFLTMLLGGVWHGANWTFVLWGAWHGLWLAIEKYFGMAKKNHSFNTLKWLLTFFIVVVGWIMFRADSVDSAFQIYGAMFGLSYAENGLENISSSHIFMLYLAFFTLVASGYVQRLKRDIQVRVKRSTYYFIAPIFVISVLKLSAQSYSPFLYFQF
jgi:alginate O-acetyltransferase complex protein AlgI